MGKTWSLPPKECHTLPAEMEAEQDRIDAMRAEIRKIVDRHAQAADEETALLRARLAELEKTRRFTTIPASQFPRGCYDPR